MQLLSKHTTSKLHPLHPLERKDIGYVEAAASAKDAAPMAIPTTQQVDRTRAAARTAKDATAAGHLGQQQLEAAI